MQEKRIEAARDVFINTLGANVFVALSKLTWGFMSNSLSLIADGFHSLLDASSNIIGIVALNFSMEPADEEHPYGHRKFEAIAAMAISFFLFLASFQVVKVGAERIILQDMPKPIVTWVSYAIVGINLVISFYISRYQKKRGGELKNKLLLADAEHTLSDVYTSIAVLASFVAIQLNFIWLDIMTSLVIVVMIFKAGYQIIMAHFGSLVDAAVLDPDEVENMVLDVKGVVSCHKIRSRGTDDNVFLDLHVQVPPSLTIQQAHEIASRVEDKLKNAYPERVMDVLVHVEDPHDDDHD